MECARELVGSGVVGLLAFPSFLGASQYAFKGLGVSCAPGLRSSLLGLASVTVASCGASLAAIKTISVLQRYQSSQCRGTRATNTDVLVSAACGVVLFRALGGRFSSVLPSNLMKPGAFAVEGIPAIREMEPACRSEKNLIQFFGERHGCHTCGRQQRGVKFIADHQPPTKLFSKHQGGKSKGASLMFQWLYPHCTRCSSTQGGLLSGQDGMAAAWKVKAIVTHATVLRPYHLFLPFPFAVAYLRSGTNNGDKNVAKSAQVNLVEQNSAVVDKHEAGTVKHCACGDGQPAERRSKGVQTSPQESSLVDVDVVLNSPIWIAWQRIVSFLDSFTNPLTSYHITLWAFAIVAALGTI